MALPSFPSGGFERGEFSREILDSSVGTAITELTNIAEPSASNIASVSRKVLEHMRTLRCLSNGRDIDQVLGILDLVREEHDLLTALPTVIACITHIRTRLAEAGVLHFDGDAFSDPKLVRVTPEISPEADVVETLLGSDQQRLQKLMMTVIKAFLDILKDVSYGLEDLQSPRGRHYLDMSAGVAEIDEAETSERVVEPLPTRTSSDETAPVLLKSDRTLIFERSSGKQVCILGDMSITWDNEFLPGFIEYYVSKTQGRQDHVDVRQGEIAVYLLALFPDKKRGDIHNFLSVLIRKLSKYLNPPIGRAKGYGMIRMFPIKGAQGESKPVNEIEKHLLIEKQLDSIFPEEAVIESDSEADFSQDGAIHRATTEQSTLDMKVTETGMSEGATWIFEELTKEKGIIISIADICSHLKINKASQDREIAFFITEISNHCRSLGWTIVRRNEKLQIRS